jgi:hypothetical protein
VPGECPERGPSAGHTSPACCWTSGDAYGARTCGPGTGQADDASRAAGALVRGAQARRRV